MKKLALTILLAGFTTLSADGASDFKKCTGCHGVNAEKSALGKSKIIAGWSKDKLKNSLNGYKDGSYGGSMKMLMKGQVVSLSSSQIDALADYISKK